MRSPPCSPMRTAGAPTVTPSSTSTVTLSIETVPTSGRRTPPTSTSALLVSPRRTPSRVADRQRGQERLAVGDEAPPVARALAGRDRLDRGRVGLERQRRLEAVGGRVLVERVEAVDRDPAADEVEVRARLAQRRRAVRRVEDQLRVARPSAARPRPRTARAARRGTRRRARRRSRSGSSARRRPRLAASRVASSASRVPSRPMPVSSLTCSRAPSAASAKPSVQATRSASAASATSSSSGEIAPRMSSRPSIPAIRRSIASPAVATASHVAPPGQRRGGGRRRAVPVAVALDHRAERSAGRRGVEHAAVALDRREVHAGEGAQRHRPERSRRGRPHGSGAPARFVSGGGRAPR